MVGGLLVDRFGYHSTFLITAGMHTVSVLLRTPLLLLVPKGNPSDAPSGTGKTNVSDSGARDLDPESHEAPLLDAHQSERE